MSHELSLEEIQKKWHGSYLSYFVGFTSAIVLTAASFLLVIFQIFSTSITICFITLFALIQALCQLLFFLHVGQEEKPKWETMIFFCMLTVLLIIAAGSLWIMFDLNYRVMGLTTTH